MPSIDDNLKKWGSPTNWDRGGDEWSDSWGTNQALWYGTILRRVALWLPAGHILELAPGHGRVTQFLLPFCERYTGVDVAPLCIDACETRFAAVDHAEFHVGDGKSLPQFEAESVDFVFSWDSLVHADKTALEGYLTELGTLLRPGAHGFLHHSNLGVFVENGEVTVDNPHWCDASTSAAVIRELCRAANLQCVAQELIQWGTPYHGDCFTVLRRPAAGEAVDLTAAPRLYENPYMNEEIGYCRTLDAHYRGASGS
jgi:SAM-dependent methyltransferase